MSKPAKIALGVATIWPGIYVLVFLGFMLYLLTNMPTGESGLNVLLPFFVVHIGTMLWNIGLLIFYIVHLFKNDRIENSMKALWAIVLFFGSLIAMPIYWYLYIWSPETRSMQGA